MEEREHTVHQTGYIHVWFVYTEIIDIYTRYAIKQLFRKYKKVMRDKVMLLKLKERVKWIEVIIGLNIRSKEHLGLGVLRIPYYARQSRLIPELK